MLWKLVPEAGSIVEKGVVKIFGMGGVNRREGRGLQIGKFGIGHACVFNRCEGLEIATQIAWLTMAETFVYEEVSLKENPVFDRKPVQIFQVRGYARVTRTAGYDSTSSVLQPLKSLQFRSVDIKKERITVIKTATD